MAQHPDLLSHHRHRIEFRGFRQTGIMAETHLQPYHPADDRLSYSLSLVCFRGRPSGAPPSLHLWSNESHQLSPTIHHRLLYLLRLRPRLLQLFRHHLRRHGWMWYGYLPVSLRPLLV